MKKRLTYLLMLLLTLAPMACEASGLTAACANVDFQWLERMPGYWEDRETGEWTYVSDETAALLRANEGGAMNGFQASAVFYLRIEGNRLTGGLRPVLVVDYQGSKAQNARAVSMLVNGTRYDIPVVTERVEEGGHFVERMRALLDERGLQMLREIREARAVRLQIHGDKGYATMIEAKKTGSKEKMERASLDGLASLDVLDGMGYGSYGMAADDRAVWEEQYGFEPRVWAFDVEGAQDIDGAPQLAGEMRLISSLSSGARVTQLQKKLVEKHYLYATANGVYGGKTRAAVEDVQRMSGLIVTGSCDDQVLAILYGDAPPMSAIEVPTQDAQAIVVAGEAEAQAGVRYQLPQVAEVELGRYWFARRVNTSAPTTDMSYVQVSNADNVFLALDGRVKGLAPAEASLNWAAMAVLTFEGGYTYEANLYLERDEGSRFDGTLLPLYESRLVVAAEIPAHLASSGLSWTLRIAAGENSITYASD